MGINNRIKLQIERKGFIDLYEDVNIPITKLLADIRDLSSRSGGYSTTIEVPGSKNNLNLFGHLYEINIVNSTFSLKKKYKCMVIKDDIQIFEGYIRMEGINKYEGPDGNTLVSFNISLHDDVGNFFIKIKDKFINPDENIDVTNNIFWDDLIIPRYNYTGITTTFENTVEDKWKFFLPTQTRGYYQTTDFKPCIFAYEYVERIVSSAGYTWNGSKDGNGNFVDVDNWNLLNNNTNFDKLVIPYAGSSEIPKSLPFYDVYAGIDVIKYSAASVSVLVYVNSTSTTGNTIGLGSGGYTPKLAIGDKIKVVTGTIYGTFYLEVQSIINDTGIFRDYEVRLCDSSGMILKVQNTIPNGFYSGVVTAYWPSKYYLNPSVFSDAGSILYASQDIYQSYKLTGTPYSDLYKQLSVIDKDRDRNILSIVGNLKSVTINAVNISGNTDLEQSIFTSQLNGNLDINVTQNYSFYIINGMIQSYLHNDLENTTVNVNARLKVYKNGTEMTEFERIQNIYTLNATTTSGDTLAYFIGSGTTTITDNSRFQISTQIPVIKGDVIAVKVTLEIQYDNNGLLCFWKESPTCVSTFCVNLTIQHIFTTLEGNISFKIKGNIQEDDENLSLKYFIPKKIKQSDLLLGLCKVLNLFIDYDEITKTLLFLPRDQYYSLGKQYDWSEKLDISNKNNFIYYNDLKYKNYIYTYKLDSDDYSKAYNNNVKETYGQVNISFENDLLAGTTTIDSIFYSTPIARVGGAANLYDGDCSNPLTVSGSLRVDKDSGNLLSIIDYTKTTNLKLLYDNGLISDPKSVPFYFRIQSALPLPTGNTVVFNCSIAADPVTSSPAYNVSLVSYVNQAASGYYKYPQIGHFLNGPTQPSDDLNYALCDYYFYDDIQITTQNNLFYKHFLRTIRQQRDCKLLKAKIHLSPAEINEIRFNDSFYLFDTWWFLNKFEYNEDGSDLYNVELINII